MNVPPVRSVGTATYRHDAWEGYNLYYVALNGRQPGPYRKQVHVQAILDIAEDGTLAGIELIDNMPPPPKAIAKSNELLDLSAYQGQDADDVLLELRTLYPDMQINKLPHDAIVTEDMNPGRIRIFADANNQATVKQG